ncbi:unnamed protein product [Effrenium voratum]|uniref:Uncharacterized protein n=1 Tax=Effrenium voratum TaxID=2562239 RepID=A0AA36JF55_9DINO|nr:unnamed protein product [Effrenium voratum]
MEERAKALKTAKAEALQAKASEVEPEQRTRVQFGDVVQRPPIFSREALKLGARAKSAKPGMLAAKNLADYASKVQNAYEEVKRKRREASQANTLGR